MIVYHFIITLLWCWHDDEGEQQTMATISGLNAFDDFQSEDVLYAHALDQAAFQCRAGSLGTDSEIPDRAAPFTMFYQCILNE